MRISDISLICFVTANCFNIIFLWIDIYLIYNGNLSITKFTKLYPLFGISLFVFELSVPISLGLHMYFD